MYWIYTAVCSCSLAITLAATPFIKSTAIKYKKLDAPSTRKIHYRPMVRLGGIAIFTATFTAVIAGLFCIGSYMSVRDELGAIAPLLAGGFAFFMVGVSDDLFDLSAINRLWLQLIISTLLWTSGLQIERFTIPGFDEALPLGLMSLPITLLWIVGVINAVNWIDGLDGLAAGVSAIALTTLVVMAATQGQWVSALVGTALLGSLIGFLFYNYNPAKIFMGDGGSYFIGFVLASLCIIGPFHSDISTASLLPLAILAVPIGDMTGVIVLRLWQRKSPFEADNLHLHHRLLKMQFSHRETVWVLYWLTALTCSLALVLTKMISGLWLVLGLITLGTFLSCQIIGERDKKGTEQGSLRSPEAGASST